MREIAQRDSDCYTRGVQLIVVYLAAKHCKIYLDI